MELVQSRAGRMLTAPRAPHPTPAVVPSKACDSPFAGRGSGDCSVREVWLRWEVCHFLATLGNS